MIKSVGYCHGIRELLPPHVQPASPGEPPPTPPRLLPRDFLIFIDESHVTIPQLHGMWHGAPQPHPTKPHRLRLPPFALRTRQPPSPLRGVRVPHRPDHLRLRNPRPLRTNQVRRSSSRTNHIRPTGLIYPQVEIRPVKGQIDDLLAEIRDRTTKNQRVLVTTLTKRMSEDLASYYTEVGVRCRYMHLLRSKPSSVSAYPATSAKASTTSSSASTSFAKAS